MGLTFSDLAEVTGWYRPRLGGVVEIDPANWALLERENEKLLDRVRSGCRPPSCVWNRWEQACDFLDDDMAPVAHDSPS